MAASARIVNCSEDRPGDRRTLVLCLRDVPLNCEPCQDRGPPVRTAVTEVIIAGKATQPIKAVVQDPCCPNSVWTVGVIAMESLSSVLLRKDHVNPWLPYWKSYSLLPLALVWGTLSRLDIWWRVRDRCCEKTVCKLHTWWTWIIDIWNNSKCTLFNWKWTLNLGLLFDFSKRICLSI